MCVWGCFTLAELLSAFPWPTFLLEPSQQRNISSHEYIICANLTVLLLTVLFVLHSPAVVQNQFQHLWACTVVVQQLNGPLPGSLEGTLQHRSAPDFLAASPLGSLVDVAAVESDSELGVRSSFPFG